MSFPSDFLFGYSQSGPQVESLDKRGWSIWDQMCDHTRKVHNKWGWEVKTNFDHRWKEEIDILAKYEFNCFRLSLSMSRIMPEKGVISQEGLDFYQSIVEYCHERGIKVLLTLYHWDLPQWIQDEGGWQSREAIVKYFPPYGKACASHIHPDYWTTINEPWCIAFLGYRYASNAPAIRLEPNEIMDVVHNINLAHGLLLDSIRSVTNTPVGICFNPYYFPASEDWVRDLHWDLESAIFTSPIFEGKYPEEVEKRGLMPSNIHDWDMQYISKPIDFYGINYYFENTIKKKRTYPFTSNKNADGVPVNSMEWRLIPEGLYRLLVKMDEVSHHLPVFITENGYGDINERIEADGTIHDTERWKYVSEHLHQCLLAIEAGIPLKGYFQWALTDNFEWKEGFKPRFGGVFIDYEHDCKRIEKLSIQCYSEYVRGVRKIASEIKDSEGNQ